ncbi:hypothetical protein CRYUN_Cryun38cG0002200 [Craigia yunnanensis]
MVWLGELIEHRIKTKKLKVLKPSMGNEPVEGDGESQVVFSNQQHGGHTPYSTNREPKLKKEKYRLDPIPMTYTELFPHLIVNHLVKLVILKPLIPHFPKWYNSNAHYEYHAGILGHIMEDYTPFKHKVQGLVRSSVMNFNELDVAGVFLPN